METQTASPESPAPRAPGRRPKFFRIAATGSAALLLVAILFVLFTSLTESKVIWLTPSQLSLSTKPSRLTQMKQTLASWTWPLWRRFRPPARLIRLESHLLTLSPTALEEISLGVPATTNLDGMRAWILAPPASESLQQRIKTNSGVAILSSPVVQTLQGGQASIGDGSSGSNLTVDLIPKASSGIVRLTVRASATERQESPASTSTVRTNFAVACQAVIPSGGCLVLDGGPPKAVGGKRFWMILSPTTVDAQGKPIKR